MDLEQILYTEKQRMNQWWLWLLIALITILIWYAFFQQIIMDHPFGQNPASNPLLIIFWLIFGIGFPIFFYMLQLRVTISKDQILIRFYPIVKRVITKDQIKSFKAITYRPIMEYGGWGIRGFKDNRAYIAAGKKGVMIELIDGHKVLVGSQTPEKLEEAIKKL